MELGILINYTIELSISAVIGLIIGIERAIQHKAASIRTFSFICTGCCLFAILSDLAANGVNRDPTRIAANILTGVGFIGGGVIFKSKNKIEGITTAAIIWVTSGLGMACGFGYTELALVVFVLYVILYVISKFFHDLLD
jgi:putative Mg2+ transporter-C (MgtC) family protein